VTAEVKLRVVCGAKQIRKGRFYFSMTKDKTGSENALSKRGGAAPAEGAAMSSRSEIAAFLTAAKSVVPASAGGSGRLAFALDATMSRQPTWDSACKLQAEMFDAVGKTAALSVQLVYFRARRMPGLALGQRHPPTGRSDDRIDCRGGQTQIGRVLRHVADEAKVTSRSVRWSISAMRWKRTSTSLPWWPESWRCRKVPCFMFHEGHDPAAAVGFREIARVTGGAYVRFDQNAASELASAARAVAAYATGGTACAGEVRRISGAPAARAIAINARRAAEPGGHESDCPLFWRPAGPGRCRRWPDERQSVRPLARALRFGLPVGLGAYRP
jgi:hypothetical protein